MEETLVDKICKIRREFDMISNSHSDDVEFTDTVSNALEESQLLSEEKIRQDYQKNAESERLLKIGIVGAVKAGKSSLLNALFFSGQDILPKAATPMTAALTELTYAEKFSVTVDFFTEEDIGELKKKSEDYKRKYDSKKTKKFEEAQQNWYNAQKHRDPNFNGQPSATDMKKWEEIAEKAAQLELNKDLRLSGANEQYQKIVQSSVQRKTDSESFEVDSITKIAGQLEDYVGSSGKYMPFTSKVSITLPIKELEGISVIDTPGFNDPVPSRDERARQALRECDAIFILSKATPFLTSNDMDVISKITKTNKIRELYIIPSQVDASLIAPEIKEASRGDLTKALEQVKDILTEVVKKNFSNQYDAEVFEVLVKEPDSRMFLTSGQCESMASTFNDKNNWDSGKQTTWKNLNKFYPDYFSDSDPDTSLNSLELLGNIKKIRGCVDTVKGRKKQIFEERLASFGSRYQEAIENTKKMILEDICQREDELKKTNINQVEEEIKKMEMSYSEIAPELDDVFIDTVIEWYNETKQEYESWLSGARGEAKGGLSSAESSRTETRERAKIDVFLLRHFFKETYNVTVNTVNATSVKNTIMDYIDDYNAELPHYLNTEIYRLTKKVMANVQRLWSNHDMTGFGSLTLLRNRVRSIMQQMCKDYDLEYKGKSFSGGTGILEGYRADEFVSEANSFIGELSSTFRKKLKAAIDDVLSNCKKYEFSKNVLEVYKSSLEKKKKDLEFPKLAIENFKRMKKEIEKISW